MFCMSWGFCVIWDSNDCIPGDVNKEEPLVVELLDVVEAVEDVVAAFPPQGLGNGAAFSPVDGWPVVPEFKVSI